MADVKAQRLWGRSKSSAKGVMAREGSLLLGRVTPGKWIKEKYLNGCFMMQRKKVQLFFHSDVPDYFSDKHQWVLMPTHRLNTNEGLFPGTSAMLIFVPGDIMSLCTRIPMQRPSGTS